MKKFRNPLLWFIIALTVICIVIDLPKIPINIHFWKINIDTEIKGPDLDLKLFGYELKKEFNIKEGLDIKGGTQLVLEADMTGITENERQDALDSVRAVIQRRVDLFGVGETGIQTSKIGDSYRIIIELPGITNVEEAIKLIGQTAQLEFREIDENAPEGSDIYASTKPTGITGSDLKKAIVEFDPNSGKPYIGIEFTDDGGKKFAEVTSRLVGKALPIFLDKTPVSFPTVNEAITGGKAQITGTFTVESAKQLAIQLNAGALPVPIKGVVEQRKIDATLGADSIRKSVIAGIIGLLTVMIFMILSYGKLGVIADIALIIYGLITLAFYKIIPVTLTMSGMAGFIISIGMAVDSNILIFERIKEERRWGKPKAIAMELGFGRAWDAIRDANIATLITGFILFNPLNFSFLNVSGPIRGFALTLLLGIGISLFTGITVTRVLLRAFYAGGKK